MILGLLSEHYTQAWQAPGRMWDADSAFADVTFAALKHNAADAVHYFTSPSPFCPGTRGPSPDMVSEFGPERVQVRHVTELSKLALDAPYIFLATPGSGTDVALLRSTEPVSSYPVCYIVRMVPQPHMLVFILKLQMLAEAFDVVVSSSRAAQQALDALLETASEYAAVRWNFGGPPRLRTVSIPLGVDSEFLRRRDRHLCREALGLPQNAIVSLHMGRLSEASKADLEPLLCAFKELAHDRPDLCLVIAGKDGPERYAQTLERLAGSLGIGDQVRLIPNFAPFVKPLLLSAADIFIELTDNTLQTFGLPVLEAMACGLPVLASDWAGHRDLVVPGQTGFLVPTFWDERSAELTSPVLPFLSFPSGEHALAQRTVVDPAALFHAWKQMTDSFDLRSRFGEQARAHVLSHFTWRTVAARFADLWSDQRARLHQGHKDRSKLTGDFNAIFGHFATAILDPEVVIRRGSLPTAGRFSSPPAGVTTTDIERVFQICDGSVKTAGELLDGSPATASAVCWLLKKGYLERIESDSRTDNTVHAAAGDVHNR